MAKSSSSVYGFYFRKSLTGLEHPASLDFKMTDSATFTLGDTVRLDTSGYLQVGSNGEVGGMLGIIVGFVDENGINAFSPRASAHGASLTPDDTLITASTNTTGAHYIKAQVVLDPAGDILWYNDSNGTLAQANLGQFFDTTAAGDRIDQATASDTSGTFQLLQIDPDGDGDASKGLFRIAEGQLGIGLNEATVKIKV